MKMAGLIEAVLRSTGSPSAASLPVMKMAGLIEAAASAAPRLRYGMPSGHENGRPH